MIPIAGITDEFSPDLDTALSAMARVGMTGAELRVIGGRNIVELTDDEVDRAAEAVAAHGMSVVSIASPGFKYVLADGLPVDERFKQDIFGAAYTSDDHSRISSRAIEIARRTGANLVRVFSYWRTIDPVACRARVVASLGELADRAADHGVVIGLENEAACNVGTGVELGELLAAIDHPFLKAIWDPANATLLDEVPYPDGYEALPKDRIAHVHAKDCRVNNRTPEWGPIGDMGVDWRGQIQALTRDRYQGWISLETHWRGPRGDKLEASMICGARLRDLVRGS